MNELWTRKGDTTLPLDEPFGQRVGQVGVVERDARWVGATLAWSGSLLLVVIVVVAVTSPAKECISLWNAPDNSKVRAAVAAGGYRHAGLTAYSVDGPGRICYVTMLDHTRAPGFLRHLARVPLNRSISAAPAALEVGAGGFEPPTSCV